MMTFVNQHSPGLRTLAAHRVVSGLPAFDAADLLRIATPLAASRRVATRLGRDAAGPCWLRSGAAGQSLAISSSTGRRER